MTARGPQTALDSRLLIRLARFTSFLRGHGLPVGVGAEVDLADALHRVGVLHRETFLEACRATLAKSPSDLRILEDAFETYWSADLPAEGDAAMSPPETPPRPPAADGRSSGRQPPRGAVPAPVRPARVSVGAYSPDAPPPGHSLAPLPDRTLVGLRMGARRLRRWSASLPGRRWEPARRGSIDFVATAKASLRHGGEWVIFRRERRRLLRTDFLILWDVSGSMREHDDVFFGIVHALRRVAPRSCVLAFSTSVEELTARLRGLAYAHALDAVVPILDAAEGGTRIGECLSLVREQYSRLVRPTATVVVLSDGWDLGEGDRLQMEIAWIRRRAHRVVWVSPYAARPGFEPQTAGLRAALPYLDLLLGPEDLVGKGALRSRASPASARVSE